MKKTEEKMFQSTKADSNNNIVKTQVSTKTVSHKTITATGKDYLGEVMSELPDNVFLNKIKTGCGLTSLALRAKGKTVVAVPYKNLVESKTKWCENEGIDLLIVAAGVAKNDILNFKGDKILTTYDSLGKVVEALEENETLNDHKLVVDEAHNLVAVADYRGKAVRMVLDNYERFGSFLFATATPIPDEYQLPSLKTIPTVTIDWGSPEKIIIKFSSYKVGVTKHCAELGVDFINNKESGNAHIFINSVKEIVNAILYMQKIQTIDPSDVRIICANTEENAGRIKDKLGSSFSIGSINGDSTKVNFYTGTAFEGCDIYDKDGKTYVFVNGNKDHTKINLLTELPQIAGRIRDSKYNGELELHYFINMFQDVVMSKKEYGDRIKKELQKRASILRDYKNSDKEGLKRYAFEGMKSNEFIFISDSEPVLNDELWYNKMYQFSTLREVYNMNGTEIVEGIKTNSGIEYVYKKIPQIELKILESVKLDKNQSFADQCKIYFDHRKINPTKTISPNLMIDKQIIEAYDLIGKEKIEKLNFSKKKIKEECVARSTMLSSEGRIIKLLKLRTGEFYSNKELKLKLVKIYANLSINKSPKASDIEKWYVVEKVAKRINKIQTRGYKILAAKSTTKA